MMWLGQLTLRLPGEKTIPRRMPTSTSSGSGQEIWASWGAKKVRRHHRSSPFLEHGHVMLPAEAVPWIMLFEV